MSKIKVFSDTEMYKLLKEKNLLDSLGRFGISNSLGYVPSDVFDMYYMQGDSPEHSSEIVKYPICPDDPLDTRVAIFTSQKAGYGFDLERIVLDLGELCDRLVNYKFIGNSRTICHITSAIHRVMYEKAEEVYEDELKNE